MAETNVRRRGTGDPEATFGSILLLACLWVALRRVAKTHSAQVDARRPGGAHIGDDGFG
jgi:hypothetical protein